MKSHLSICRKLAFVFVSAGKPFAIVVVYFKRSSTSMLHNKTVEDLLQVKEIYLEPDVKNYKQGSEILAKYPEATLIEVLRIGKFAAFTRKVRYALK
jgi:hypothetical protein